MLPPKSLTSPKNSEMKRWTKLYERSVHGPMVDFKELRVKERGVRVIQGMYCNARSRVQVNS